MIDVLGKMRSNERQVAGLQHAHVPRSYETAGKHRTFGLSVHSPFGREGGSWGSSNHLSGENDADSPEGLLWRPNGET